MVLQTGSYFVVPIIVYCCYTLHFVDSAFVTALTGNWRLLWTWNSSLISAWFQCSKAARQISFHVWIWRRKVSVGQVVESIWWVTFDFQTSLSVIILWPLRFSGKQRLDCIRYYLLVFMVSGLFMTSPPPFPSNRHHRSNDDFLDGKRENYQVCSVEYCVQQLYTVNCTHLWTELTVLCIGFCLTGPISLCLLDSFLCMYNCILHACVVL